MDNVRKVSAWMLEEAMIIKIHLNRCLSTKQEVSQSETGGTQVTCGRHELVYATHL